MKQLKICVVQMDCELKNKELNLQKAIGLIEKYGPNVDVISFPELFSTGYDLKLIGDEFYELAECIPGPTVEQLAEKAKQYEVAIIANIVEKDMDQEAVLYDTAFVINEKGQYLGKYRKVHLYPTEHQYFRAGLEFPVFEIFNIPIGVAICYDHAFQEMFRILALQGAKIVFIPSVVPKNYEYLLNLRTRARAQDNQIFTVAANRVGQEGNIDYCGLSKIVNPKGEIICEASGEEEDVIIGSIDLSLIAAERKQEPVLRNRRPELYQKLSVKEVK